jgi:2-dehydropantoate 2-reductase
MRILVVGAGAVGGYFGGRLLEKGEDVTFLVREKRKQQLQQTGLVIKSVQGDVTLNVQTLVSGEESDPFDLVILAVKEYHLDQALHSVHPYIGSNTTILPLLNGISHLEKIKAAFPQGHLLGGLCFIEATLNKEGHIEHYIQRHDIIYGELDGQVSERIKQIKKCFSEANMNAYVSKQIIKRMWHKYIFISTLSGITSLMRSSIGPILSVSHGKETVQRLIDEIVSIAQSQEPSINPNIAGEIMQTLESAPPSMTSSMHRDLEKGLPIETDHFHGTLLKMAPDHFDLPLLKTIYSTLSLYQQAKKNE